MKKLLATGLVALSLFVAAPASAFDPTPPPPVPISIRPSRCVEFWQKRGVSIIQAIFICHWERGGKPPL